MTIDATSSTAAVRAGHAATRASQPDHDRASNEFAGVFAGAVHSTARPVEHKSPKDGTSDLDRTDGNDDDKAPDPTNAALPGEIIQSLAALDPELQAKLARVVSRMRTETGQEVTIAETYRSQGRQNALFAQGRNAPGPVVTWTLNSKHTQGRAVDLLLEKSALPGDGSAADAYAVLQRIAREEGLRTLGPTDPGHLELAGGADVGSDATPSSLTAQRAATGDQGTLVGQGRVPLARLAEVAPVAQVAEVAQVTAPAAVQVARVAAVASVVPGASGAEGASVVPRTERASPDAGRPAAPDRGVSTDGVSVLALQAGGRAENGGGAGAEDRGDNPTGDHRGGYGALAAAVAHRAEPTFQAPVLDVNSTGATAATERAAKLIAAYEDAPARPLSRIIMSVDAGNGVADRIQVALRGTSLNATIDAADPTRAHAMQSRSDELVRALTRDGLSVDALHVRAAAGTAVTTAPSSSGADASSHSRSERNQAWPQPQDRQRSSDDRRHQQRQERGGHER